MSQSFVLVDGNSLMHRAFHALPPLSNEDGVYTNAVYGFLTMLLKVVEEEQPAYLAVAFDMKGPTFRHADYKEYKAGRKPTAPELIPQFDLIRSVLTDMGVQILTCPTYEGDDILGTFARKCEEAGIPALIVTGDRDALQLVTETSNVLYTKRGVTEVVRYTPEKVLEDFSVKPSQITDLKGLMGDSSDNIPGIPGIGEKTAVKLLTQYGSLEEAIAHADTDLKGKQREKMIEGAASGLLSKKLATICRTVPLDVQISDCRTPDLSNGIQALEKLGMNSIISRLTRLGQTEPEEKKPARTYLDPINLPDAPSLCNFLEENTDAPISLLFGNTDVQLACTDGRTAVITLGTDLLSPGPDPAVAASWLKPLLTGTRTLILYDAKRFMTQLADGGLTLSAPIEDDIILQYLLAPQQGKHEAPASAAALLDRTEADLAAVESQGMLNLYREIELPLIRTLFDMETVGFLVDRDELVRLGKSYDELIQTTKDEIFQLAGVSPFNLNSTQQLGELLFVKLGLPTGKKTSKGGFSTDAETLEKLSDQHPVIDKILLYRKASKLKNTYIEGLTRLIAADGRIHTWFDQTTASTGRISSSEPNLQNIPVRTEMGREIRRAFIAKPGCVLVDADYSQIELRLLAHLSGDETMRDAFLRGQDIHARTAAEVYGVPLDEVTSAMRSSAKAVNFGIVYGISDFGLAANLHIKQKEAADFIARYFARYPAVRRFMDDCVALGKRDGYSLTLYGRRRPLPELNSPNYARRQFGERIAMNAPVQGTAADIIKMAMNAVHNRLSAEGLQAKLILQVHDELIVETPEEEQEKVTSLLKECMESAVSLSVPLIADVHAGHSWFETK